MDKKYKNSFIEDLNEYSKVDKLIAVVSGKGGVGKSLITSLLAVEMNKKGYKTAILDADITGPSIPRAFGLKENVRAFKEGIQPARSKNGIEIISMNLLLENENDPVVWRSPIVINVVKQFWNQIVWDEIDYMFVDMPPGTGDIPLTVFQSLPIDGVVMVTSPQDLVSMIVGKAIKMANMMNIPILGLVENMSYFTCPDNGKDYEIFGPSKLDELAKEYNIGLALKAPIDPKIAEACDQGRIEEIDASWLEEIVELLEEI